MSVPCNPSSLGQRPNDGNIMILIGCALGCVSGECRGKAQCRMHVLEVSKCQRMQRPWAKHSEPEAEDRGRRTGNRLQMISAAAVHLLTTEHHIIDLRRTFPCDEFCTRCNRRSMRCVKCAWWAREPIRGI